jgi:hypothetical protein
MIMVVNVFFFFVTFYMKKQGICAIMCIFD